MSRAERERLGRIAEIRAALWLNLHFWWVLDRRVKTPLGEIDLVARRGRTVAFIEVKYRRTAKDLDTAIDEYRLKRVAAAVEAVGHRYLRARDNPRIDVLLLAPGHFPRHIVNAWQP
ncbi:MAG TPA: YraN family protein [Sphingomonadaceae bacterium]|nr:YraN family protein [Sphingomonadaceae bacterium]